MRNRVLIPTLILSLGLFMGLKLRLERIPREKVPGSSLIYVPSGQYLKFASFGYPTLLADLVYIWAIQYYSNTAITDRFDYLDHIFAIIAELDPRYLDPYELGAIIGVYEAKSPELAFRILDRGLEKNPDQWIFPFQAGHYAQMVLKDYGLAREYYAKTMAVEGAPPIAQRLYANAAFKTMDYAAAWQSWLEIFQTASDERIKKIASNHLYQVKASIDTQTITAAVLHYRERFGPYPQTLEELVRAGFLAGLPQDLDGRDYVYDSQTGSVKPPQSPWKR